MRLHFRKVVAVGAGIGVLWLIFTYYSTVEIPTPVSEKSDFDMSGFEQSPLHEFEVRFNNLIEKIKSENKDVDHLLHEVKHYSNDDSGVVHVPEKDNEDVQGLSGELVIHSDLNPFVGKVRIELGYHFSHLCFGGISLPFVKSRSQRQVPPPHKNTVLPVLVIACDRVTVKRCLDNLVKLRPNKEIFPIIVSQDCGHNATYQVIKGFTEIDPSITIVRQPDLSEIVIPRHKVKFRGYYKIARHFKFALNYVFKTLGHEAVIIVEDDLDISPDFFEYFLGTYPLLEQDPSIWCISAWNDNGKRDVIDMNHPELLHRTDFFPGLGWLLRRESWLDLEPKWPPAFFDDWLRDPVNTHGRSCIRPEVSRTYSFGKIGVSKGLFFDLHLRHMQLNMQYIEFTKLDLTYLLKSTYDEDFVHRVYSAMPMSADEVTSLRPGPGDAIRVSYSDARTYQKAAKKLGLMDDFRSGIPRTAYMGVVSCFVRGRRVYLAPSFDWARYDPSWA